MDDNDVSLEVMECGEIKKKEKSEINQCSAGEGCNKIYHISH